ncbi:hypothetical protein [uncultured Roseobacter sp.]|uniref:hypothetical protein n=1 Tax=uncultured Roseobacter sp. TaxID=114847 RepID=UPI00261EC76D|nr:hypothetical protein [uncultured Roseobacter sp.]
MVFLKELSAILAELGFSFWQLVVLAVALVFRRDVSLLAQRVSKFKLAGNEIELDRDSNPISDLLDLKSEIAEKNLEAEQLAGEIEEKIHLRTLGAMINIKKNTSFLWEAGFVKNTGTAVAQIRRNTLQRVSPDLELLEELELISTSRRSVYQGFDGDEVLEIAVEIESPDLRTLVQEAERY